MKSATGFTLIELLIVVAIIAILAAIAIPNFLAAQIRSKVARVSGEMQTLTTALESYYVDNNAYPWAYLASIYSDFNARLREITTPIAYISSLPADPFTLMKTAYPFRSVKGTTTYEYEDRNSAIYGFYLYHSETEYTRFFSANTKWSLNSAGPDQKNLFQFGTPVNVPATEDNQIIRYTYDPTNGTISNGDIWRYGP
ncbi:MAG: type II secretion system protein [bacterium]